MTCKYCNVTIFYPRTSFCSDEHKIKYMNRNKSKALAKQKDILKSYIPEEYIYNFEFKEIEFIPSIEWGKLESQRISQLYREATDKQFKLKKVKRKTAQGDSFFKKMKVMNTNQLDALIQSKHKLYRETLNLDVKRNRDSLINRLKNIIEKDN